MSNFLFFNSNFRILFVVVFITVYLTSPHDYGSFIDTMKETFKLSTVVLRYENKHRPLIRITYFIPR